ncbi:hypothetical protein M0R45_035510 [Rubus argutus]|uniref:Uncharacterized protein n=1 Tax=Rubus argutus TaxID=59490 RepID=A0AAW1VXR0_RUBAR
MASVGAAGLLEAGVGGLSRSTRSDRGREGGAVVTAVAARTGQAGRLLLSSFVSLFLSSYFSVPVWIDAGYGARAVMVISGCGCLGCFAGMTRDGLNRVWDGCPRKRRRNGCSGNSCGASGLWDLQQRGLMALSCACGVVVKLELNSGIEPSEAAMIVS